MRSVEVGSDRRLTTVTTNDPAPAPGQALIEVAACGICGSDLDSRDVPDCPLGHGAGPRAVERLTAVGDGVDGWAVGTRVCVLLFGQCGECAACRAGNEQFCLHAVHNGVGLGTGRPGGYAEKIIVDERMLFALPDAVDDRAGTLVEPLAVAVRAVAEAAVATNEPVVVIGAGPIGLLMGLVLRERGYERAVVLSRNPGRAAMARRLELTAVTLDELRSADPPACVFDCAGTPSSRSSGRDAASPRTADARRALAGAP